ncbi:flagellar motor switch protein FliN, partial [Pantoea sp. R102]
MSDSKKPSDDISADDLWAEAMNEQAATSSAAEPGDNVFKSLEASAASG